MSYLRIPITLDFVRYLDDRQLDALPCLSRKQRELMKNFSFALETFTFVNSMNIVSPNHLGRNISLQNKKVAAHFYEKYNNKLLQLEKDRSNICKAISTGTFYDHCLMRSESHYRMLVSEKDSWRRKVLSNAWLSRLSRVGNCPQIASIAFEYLAGNHVAVSLGIVHPKNLKKDGRSVSGHAFVVIGLNEGTKVVCDIWAQRIYPFEHLLAYLHNYIATGMNYLPILRKVDLLIDKLIFFPPKK